jgi:CheY-like chemotaxis protein
VLDLSKIESGKLELDRVEFDLEQIAFGAAATFQAQAMAKGLDFEFHVEDSAKGAYHGDPTRLRQLLYNLVSNAVKFTDAGWVKVRLLSEEGVLKLEVGDSGIAPGQVASLFDKFVQVDASKTRRFGGSGLGLAIAQELARAMGGQIEVKSAPGEGSTFIATLPIERGAQAAAKPAEAAAGLEIRILAAEDNDINQQVLTAVFNHVGLQPVIASNGREAVEAWENGEWDVVLMDIQMPEMDGVQATRAIRAREAATGRRRTPILAVTANAMTHQALEYEAAGMDGLVPKPIDVAKLFAAIERVLAEPEDMAAAVA